MRRGFVIAGALILVTACAAPSRTLDPPADPTPAATATPTATPTETPSPTPTPPPAAATVDPTKAMTWPTPNEEDTPGLVVIGCTYPRADEERDVSASTKRAAAKRYGYTGPTGIENVEYDHRVPFSLCGANTVANIWPEPADGVKQSAYVHNRKDALEAYAARQVRYHRWSLDFAQNIFLGDWRVAWCRYRANYASAGVTCG